MSFINWGGESPEQLALRKLIEEQALYEQAVRVSRARQSQGQSPFGGAGGSVKAEPIPPTPSSLDIVFDDIVNAHLLVGGAEDVNNWNTFFDLPNYGTPFTSVEISGNIVKLKGGSNIIMDGAANSLFYNVPSLLEFVDNIGCVTELHDYVFVDSGLTYAYLPGCTFVEAPSDSGVFSSAVIKIDAPNLSQLGAGAFEYLNNLSDLTLDFDNLTDLSPDYIFWDCQSLPNEFFNKLVNVTVLGSGCFTNCYGMTTITLPALTGMVSGGAFQNCTSLISLSLPNLITYTGGGHFSGCLSLTSVNLPLLESTVGSDFYQCTALTEISLPSVTSLGDNSFAFCSSLTQVSFPNLTYAGQYCFYSCSSLTTLSTPSLTSVDSNCFESCTSLTSFSITSLESVGHYCFSKCSALTTVSLPNATGVGTNIFNDCTSLTTVELDSLATIPDSFITYSSSLVEFSAASATLANTNILANCTALTTVNLPALAVAGSSCFLNCTALTGISLPSLEVCGGSFFSGCTALVSISIPACTDLGSSIANNSVFTGITGNSIDLTVPFNLLICNGGNPDGDIQYLQANNTVNVVTDYPTLEMVFSDVTQVNPTPTNLASWNSFFDLPTYGAPFTAVSVSGNTVTLTAGGTINLKESLFYPNAYLLEFNDGGCVYSVGDLAFYNDSAGSLTYVELPNAVSAGIYAFASDVVMPITTFIAPKMLTIGEWAFYGCYDLSTVTLPALTELGAFALAGCYSITSLSLPSLITAGDSSLLGLSGCTNLYLPNLTTAGASCFYFCQYLVNFSLPSLVNAGDYCFANCYSMGSLYLPSCTNLGSSTGNNGVFDSIIYNNTIALTVPAALMTCNSGSPDGDIQALQANNTVTVTTV